MGEEKSVNPACNAAAKSCIKNTGKNGVAQKLDFRRECDRLKSFEKWTVPFVDKSDLASAGFYYTGQRDAVKCPFCSVGLGNWVPGDQPLEEHRKQSPNCVFVQQLTSCRLIGHDVVPPTDLGEDTCGPFDTPTEPAKLEEIPSLSLLNVTSTDPKYPNFKSYEARLKTFENWPYSCRVPPDTLSLAGFVYTNIGDRTICFHCGLEMHKWEIQDDPWVEHAHWSPKCKFVLEKKGQKFIDEARAKKHDDLVQTQEVMREVVETIRQMISEPATDQIQNDENTNKSSGKIATNVDTKNERVEHQRKDSSDNSQELASCLICLNEKRDTVLLPCYHVVGCENCVKKLKNCCVCREPIIYSRKIYFS